MTVKEFFENEKTKMYNEIQFRIDMIDYIQAKIDKYETIPNMSQIISIYRALICDIKIDIRRIQEHAKGNLQAN